MSKSSNYASLFFVDKKQAGTKKPIDIYMYIYNINRLFSALLPKNLLLSVICCLLFEFKHLQCGLLCPANYRGRTIHAFPNKTWRPPWPRNIFFWALTAHHTLWARLAAVLVLQQLWCMQTGACSAEHQQLVWESAACAVVQTDVHAQCAQGMCSLEL